MRQMKDSGIEWIGQIPQEWNARKVKYCFKVYAGATPKSGNSEFWDGDIVWVTPADYTTEQKYISAGRKNITQEGFESCSTELIPAGSLIFSKRAPIGLVAINIVDMCTNQGCLSCVPCDENDVEYFYYAFSCFTEQFDLYGSGTTFKEISADAFMNFDIPYPAPEVQRQISDYLRGKCAEIDALIASKEKTNALLRERRQSIIYEAVTKGLNPNAPMKDSGIEWIGQIPDSWSVEALKRGVKIEMGQSPSSDCYNSDGIGFPFLQGNADFTDKYPVERIYTTEANKFSKIGDLLLSVRAPVGAINISDKEYAIGRGLCSITGNRVKVPFLWYAMEILKRGFDANSTGSTFESINTEDVGDAKIMVPSVTEQSHIADYLDIKCAEIDALIAANEATIRKLKEYRQSIIYEAVTGKIEI